MSHTSHDVCNPVCKNRLSRVFLLSHPSQALPSPIQRILSRPRWAALRLALGRAGGAAAPRWARGQSYGRSVAASGRCWGRAAGVAAPKGRLNFLFARAFVLVRRSLSGPAMAAAFVNALPAMQQFVERYQAPFIARVTQTGHVSLLLKPVVVAPK